jgi:putative nucleotidyltransferase with HDIG domain
MIRARVRSGPIVGLALSLVLAAALVPIATVERWLGLPGVLAAGDRAPVTVRQAEPSRPGSTHILAARGEIVDEAQAAAVNALGAQAIPGPATFIGLAVTFGLIGLLLLSYLRTTQSGRLLRVQLTVAGLVVGMAILVKGGLLLTTLPWYLAPTAAGALLAAAILDRFAGFGVAVALALVCAALMPFDSSVAIVLGAQGLGSALALGRPKRRRAFVIAGVAGGLAAAAAYMAVAYVYGRELPTAELADPARSGLLAALAGGVLSALLALACRSTVERLAGGLSRHRLMELAELESPLLKKIASEAPGTWQHSLAMANMAEIAANAIGANALLVRVGAYYHDLGKSLQPQYYIENLAAGQHSPHDELPPDLSADAIFAHVTEGVRLARAEGLPEAIIDFMHMHHGDGVLEYFWGKCLEQGNPKNLAPAAFRYPGVKPQSRETAILAIVDAVEASSRTLRRPDAKSIEQLVQRIVYGKLHLGQLDESGLAVADLRRLSNTLVDTLKHAHHVRIEYPWQREEQAAAHQVAATVPILPAASGITLDSADAPRADEAAKG